MIKVADDKYKWQTVNESSKQSIGENEVTACLC